MNSQYTLTNGHGHPKIWHPEGELFWLSEKILQWFWNDEFGVIIVHGQQGFGKSTYALISCAEVYGHDIDNSRFFYHWEAVKKHIVWHPRHFIDLSQKIPSRNDPLYKVHPLKKKKEPLCVWDDAGYFLNNMKWNDKLCIEVGRYLELARTRWGCIIFTVSHQQQILSKIRGIPHAWSVPIRKKATPSLTNQNFRSTHDRRYARLHKSWCSEDMKRSGKKGKQCDVFYARLPGNYCPQHPESISRPTQEQRKDPDITWGFYGWYAPFRDMFEEKGIEAVDVAASEIGL